MTVLRTDIERVLDEIISNEEGMRFQGIAVVLAKQKWPELVACERKKDLGLDAIARASLAPDDVTRGLASSITATLEKVKDDAKRATENFPGLSVLIFATPRKVTNETGRKWVEEISKEFGLELVIVPREDVITSLMLPQNGAICRAQLGLSFPLDQSNVDLLAKVGEAASAVIAKWDAHRRFASRPVIALSSTRIEQDSSEGADIVALAEIATALTSSRRVILEAPAGRGKTTSLVQVAKLREGESRLSFLVDLPDWIRSGSNILEFVSRTPEFLSRGVTAQHLAAIANDKSIAFLLNGWNEISEQHDVAALDALRTLERDFPAAGILVATRTHTVAPPLPGSLRLKLLPLRRAQRATYLEGSLGDRADDLRKKLQSNSALDDLTRTPFFLAEVVTLYESNVALPTTKVGVIDAVTSLVESGEPHRGHLSTPPLSGLASKYLVALATAMVGTGSVQLSDEQARTTCSAEAKRLQTAGQITDSPDPLSVLGALCAHHVLERVEHPSIAYRFEHQQFQEFFASRFLAAEIDRVVQSGKPEDAMAFQRDYLNHPAWAEPLAMLAESIGTSPPSDARTLQVGKQLITMCMDVDPIFASELARYSGTAVWKEVGELVGTRLRAWYASPNASQRECALAAMVETGSADFKDIIVPLIGGDDGRLRTRGNVHTSSLGPDWVKAILGLPEKQQVNFAFDLMRSGSSLEISEAMLAANPAPKVRLQVIEALAWFGDGAALTRHLSPLDDAEFADVVKRFAANDLPHVLWPRVVEMYAKQLETTAEPIARLRLLKRMEDFGGTSAGAEIRKELNAMTAARISDVDQRFLLEVLGVIAKTDPSWAPACVVDRILDGTLWPDHAKKLITVVSPEATADLLSKLESGTLQHPELKKVFTVLLAKGDTALATKAFAKQCEVGKRIKPAPMDPAARPAHEAVRQLESLLRQLPVQIAVDGVLANLSDWEPLAFEQAVHLFGQIYQDGEEVLDATDKSRQALRTYFLRGIDYALQQDDFGGDLKASVACALARVGSGTDAGVVEHLLTADIARVTAGRQARAKGATTDAANGAMTTQAHRFVRALLILGRDAAEPILLRLLAQPLYDSDAAAALVRLARMRPVEQQQSFGSSNHEQIWRAREHPDATYDGTLRKRYSNAISTQIAEAMKAAPAEIKPGSPPTRLRELSYQLAVLDGRAQSATVLDIQARPPSEWNGWARASALKALLFAGAEISLADAAKVLDPVVDDILKRGGLNDQDITLLMDCLCIFPFVTDQPAGIAKAREVLSRVKLRGFQLRRLFGALGASRSDAATQLLLDLANQSDKFFDHAGYEWFDAVTASNTKLARNIILSAIFAATPLAVGLKIGSHPFDERLAAQIARIARTDQNIQRQLFDLTTEQLAPPRRHLLAKILGQLGTSEAALAGLNLFDNNGLLPYETARSIGALFMEEQVVEGSSHAVSLVPRDANALRAALFELALSDPKRGKAATDILGNIELSRYEQGRPLSEPRHPDLESGKSWPVTG